MRMENIFTWIENILIKIQAYSCKSNNNFFILNTYDFYSYCTSINKNFELHELAAISLLKFLGLCLKSAHVSDTI